MLFSIYGKLKPQEVLQHSLDKLFFSLSLPSKFLPPLLSPHGSKVCTVGRWLDFPTEKFRNIGGIFFFNY